MSEVKGRPRTRSKPESSPVDINEVSHEEGNAPSLSFSEPGRRQQPGDASKTPILRGTGRRT